MIKQYLIDLLIWFLKWLGWSLPEYIPLPQKQQDFIPGEIINIINQSGRDIVMGLNKIEGVSGEYRRSLAYGRLLKKYPGCPKWKIGLAIELVMMEMKLKEDK